MSVRERVVRRLDDLGPLVICADLAELRAMLFPLVAPPVAAMESPTLATSAGPVSRPPVEVAAPSSDGAPGVPSAGPWPTGSVPVAPVPTGFVPAAAVPTGAVPVAQGPMVPGSAGQGSVRAVSAGPEGPPDGTLRLGDLAVDPADHLVTWRGEPLALTRLERELLARLATSPVIVWSYARLFATVWGGAYLGDSAILHSAVKRLRRKLRAVEGGPQIQTVRGVGYRLAVPLPATS